MRTNIIITTLAAVLICGCATENTGTSQAAQQAKPLPPEKRPKPHLGMTKDEIRAQYGAPKKVTQIPQGETWMYNNAEMAAIPFNFGFKLKWHTFTFDEAGKLVDFAVDDF